MSASGSAWPSARFFGTHFGHLGWRLAFGVSIFPGLLIAAMLLRLPEPRRGSADRAHVTGTISRGGHGRAAAAVSRWGRPGIHQDMLRGFTSDVKTILTIPTMRYALVGVSNILFVVTAVATWMPTFYQRQFRLTQGTANLAFGALVIVAGIPGTLLGGVMSDRLVPLPRRPVVIPGVCLGSAGALFCLVYSDALRHGLPDVWPSCRRPRPSPALRAGLSDAVPANLRGTGFGAFNVASIVFGSAAAPL